MGKRTSTIMGCIVSCNGLFHTGNDDEGEPCSAVTVILRNKVAIGGGPRAVHFVAILTIHAMMSQRRLHAQWQHAKDKFSNFEEPINGQGLHVWLVT